MGRGPGLRGIGAAALGILLLAVAGCATKQRIPLECVAEEVQIYVDGRLLEGQPDAIDLPVDEPHKLYFKREGHEPQLVVLRPGEAADGTAQLEPRDVCVELVPVGLGRRLTIEAEEEADTP